MKKIALTVLLLIMFAFATIALVQEKEIDRLEDRIAQLEDYRECHNERLNKIEYPVFTRKSYK